MANLRSFLEGDRQCGIEGLPGSLLFGENSWRSHKWYRKTQFRPTCASKAAPRTFSENRIRTSFGQKRQLATQPVITVPAITLNDAAGGNYPASDGSATAAKFRSRRTHRVVPDAGHNPPQEAPSWARAVIGSALLLSISCRLPCQTSIHRAFSQI